MYFDLPPLEDANSIQLALMQVTRLLLSGRIENKTAGLVLYALQTASMNLKHLKLEPDWQKVVVEPRAVKYSPLELTDDQMSQEQENELLVERLKQTEGKPVAEVPKKPCATWAMAASLPLKSRHALPTSPEEWDELKDKDFTAWMLAFTTLTLPPEAWKETEQDRAEEQRLRNLDGGQRESEGLARRVELRSTWTGQRPVPTGTEVQSPARGCAATAVS
jgi:hypothetical protein